MGIFIYLVISKSVTKKEWEKVYEETLQLIKHLPLADLREVKIHGIDTTCLVKTEEQEEPYGWNDEDTIVGWTAVGDYKYMHVAEQYYLPRDLVGENEVEPDAGDAILGALPAYMSYDWEDERFNHVYGKWGAKTQGEPYHMYLLAVAALIEARLGTKAFTYGDITRGQFKRAVEIANRYLEEPIDIPDRCHMDRLLKRVSELPLPHDKQLAVFDVFFLGTKNAEFGGYMRQMFSSDAISSYWKDRFKNYEIDTIGFDRIIGDYLLCGFGLKELCGYVNFKSKDGEYKYEDFIKRIMDAKLHLEEKNCADALKIDQEEERPYGVGTLFAQFFYAGAGNKKVDRYIPIKDIKTALIEALGSKCNVEEIIDNYLSEEAKRFDVIHDSEASEEDLKKAVGQDPAEVFNQVMDLKCKKLAEEREKYNVTAYEDLPFYEDGDTIHPAIEKSLVNGINFLALAREEEEYKWLLEGSAEKCCEWLVEENKYFLIRDEHWDKVFTNIENDINSFGRYYGLFRVKMNNNSMIDMCTALMINDELYEYSKSLMV